jgi:hypothetical protein
MVKWLFLLFLPLLSQAQVPQEELTLEAQELLDTSSINTISPHHLWQVLGLPKDLIYSFSEYRNTFGALEHPDELYYISGIDSSTAQYLLDLLPLKRSTFKSSRQIISKVRLSDAGFKSAHSVLYRSGPQSAALHLSQVAGNFQGSGFIATQQQSTSLLLGHYSMHFGQGLLFGRASFNSPTTAEYFRAGIKGQTGASTSGILKGFAVQRTLDNHILTFAHDGSAPLFSWTTTSNQIAYGIAGRGLTLSTFAKYSHGPLRLFGEITKEVQKIGGNVFYGDVLYELVLEQEKRLILKHYLSWRDRYGSWNVLVNDGKLRLGVQHKKYALIIAQHENGEGQNSFRVRYRYPMNRAVYDFHWHRGTYGWSGRRNWKMNALELQLMAAMISSNGQPIWLSSPTARGYIGAIAVYDDFVGIAGKTTWGPVSMSMSFNAAHPEKSQWQVSFFRNL